ncbi:MAG: T9SS type A sorting domain-containing protein [Bacteroidia bacterium]|nr:T9SS type A sorting domain-containing protein [Bacteroidia bacterium]
MFIILSLSANAQTQLKKWYINSYEYDMTNTTPTSIPLSNGQTGAANGIYDINGDVQFYINGNTIYDRFNNPNITNLPAFNIQEVSIVPFFNNDPCHNKYYVFYEYHYPPVYGSLQYVIVDVNRDTWGLTISTPFYMLHGVVATGGALAIGNVVNSNERYLYYAYGTNYNTNLVKFTIMNPNPSYPNGVVLPGNTLLTSTSNSYSAPDFELDLSPDGSKIAWGGGLNGDIYVFNLDANGNSPNLISALTLPNSTSIFKTGIEFNNDATKLYAGSGGKSGSLDGIYVKDLGNNNPPNLISGTQIYGAGQIERAYNGLVYITSGNDMIGIDQTTDLLVTNSQIALPGFNNYFLPDQLDGTNYDDLLNNEMIYDINNYLVQSGTHIWEPLNNPFGNTSNPVKVKDFLHFISSTPGVFTQVTIKNMVFEFGDNADMVIGNSARVILENTTLKSVDCAVMWKGITLNDNANLTTTNNSIGQYSIIQDALTGISGSGLDFRLTVHGNTLFKANQDDIRLTNYEGGNIDLHNCDFIGDVVLKNQFLGSNNGWIDNLYRTNTQLKLIDGVNNTIVGNNCNFSFGQIGVKIEKTNATINNCNFLMQKVYGISGDAKRIAQKQIDIKNNLFTSVQQPIRLENWINSEIQSNHLYGSKEYGIHYLYNDGCNVIIGDMNDPLKGNHLDFCNWVGIDLSSNADPKTNIIIGYNKIDNHTYATGICVSEFGLPSAGSSYSRLSIANNIMNNIGNGIKINNVAGWNTDYSGLGPRPHQGILDNKTVIENNVINYVTTSDPNYRGIQTTRSNRLNILSNIVISDNKNDWRNCSILADEAFFTSIYKNTCQGGLGIWLGGDMSISNAYCNDVSNSSIGIFLNYEYLRSSGSTHGIPFTQSRDNKFGSTSGIDIKLYQTNTDFNQWIFSSTIPNIDYTNATGPFPLNIDAGVGSDVCIDFINTEKSIEDKSKKPYSNYNTLQGTSSINPINSSKFNPVELFKYRLKNAKDSLNFKTGILDFPSEIAIIEDLFLQKRFDSALFLMIGSKPLNSLEREVLLVYNMIANKMIQKERKLRKGEIDTLLFIAHKNQFTQSAAAPMARILLKQELHIDIYDSLEYFPNISGKVWQNCNESLVGGVIVKLLTNSGIETGHLTYTDSMGNFNFKMQDLQFLNAKSTYKFKCILPDSSIASCMSKTLGEFTNMKELNLNCNAILGKKVLTENILKNSDFVETIVYPNPSSGLFTIECEENSEIRVYNLLGKLVYSNLHSSKSEINLGKLPKGIYILEARNNNSKTFKLIIE